MTVNSLSYCLLRSLYHLYIILINLGHFTKYNFLGIEYKKKPTFKYFCLGQRLAGNLDIGPMLTTEGLSTLLNFFKKLIKIIDPRKLDYA